MVRYFWTLFFLGSLILVAADVRERRNQSVSTDTELTIHQSMEGDPVAPPTPRP